MEWLAGLTAAVATNTFHFVPLTRSVRNRLAEAVAAGHGHLDAAAGLLATETTGADEPPAVRSKSPGGRAEVLRWVESLAEALNGAARAEAPHLRVRAGVRADALVGVMRTSRCIFCARGHPPAPEAGDPRTNDGGATRGGP